MNDLIKLLVIDDDDVDRRLLKRALKTCGFQYELTECTDVRDIITAFFLDSFDCIFLDYLLPGSNGLSLLKKIRDTGIKTPIVIITSQGNESIAVELMKAGASDYIVKNEINGQSLGQILRNVMRLTEMIREREKGEEALRISEARLAEAQRIAKIGNWEYVNASKSLYWSPEVYTLFDLDERNTPTASSFLSYVHAEDNARVSEMWSNALKGNEFNFDFRIVTSRELKYIHVQGYALLNSLGALEKIVGTLQNITERKLAEHEISKAKELAEKSMKVREIFLANMSHEIRTPMNAILGFTRLLCETELSLEQISFIDAIQFSGENLLVIINDILDLSKIQSGKMNIEKCDFSLQELVNGVLSVLRPKAQEKGLKLTYKIDQQLPSVIKGDPIRLNQVLTNLISNAIKFTEKGSVSLEINSTVIEHDNISIEFKIKDTGIGIPENMQSRVFENFVQASSDTTRKYGGTGLGLAIVKSLVELQEGKISLESLSGAGSTFTVHLPFEKVNQRAMEFATQIITANESLDALGGASVLVVEDNAVNQLLVRKVLGKTGCKVDIASNGIEALECIKSKKYDVVLMDIQMPEMDGYEATQYIRTKFPSPLSEIPIIAMTAHAYGSDITRCMSVGMNDYLSKPFKQEDLYSKIMKYLKPFDQTKIFSLNLPDEMLKLKIDLTPIYKISNGDTEFLDELILVYDKQTPAFIEKLRGYLKSHNFAAIAAICHQIKSSYGSLKMKELEKALEDISVFLEMKKPVSEFSKIAGLINVIISLITVINEEIKRGLRKAG